MEHLQLTERMAVGAGRVDTTAHVIHGVKVLGRFSKNNREYTEAALAGAVTLYEGCPVFLDHPKGSPSSPRSYAERVGTLRNVRLKDGSLFADLHYNPKHVVAEQLVHDAQHSPTNCGLSHNVDVQATKRDGRTLVTSIERVRSVDLVAQPATTAGLYESVDAELAGMTVEEIFAARPDVKAEVLAIQRAKQRAERITYNGHRFADPSNPADRLAFVEALAGHAGESFHSFAELRAMLNIGKGDLEALLKEGNVRPSSKYAADPLYSLNAVRAALVRLTASTAVDAPTESLAAQYGGRTEFLERLTDKPALPMDTKAFVEELRWGRRYQ